VLIGQPVAAADQLVAHAARRVGRLAGATRGEDGYYPLDEVGDYVDKSSCQWCGGVTARGSCSIHVQDELHTLCRFTATGYTTRRGPVSEFGRSGQPDRNAGVVGEKALGFSDPRTSRWL
jgi:hypothetical protein